MFCFNCGAQVDDNAKFCSSCGTALTLPPQNGQQSGYTAPIPPFQGSVNAPAQSAPGSSLQGGNTAAFQGVPVSPVQGADFPNTADNDPAGATVHGRSVGMTTSGAAAEPTADIPGQPGAFQTSPTGAGMQFTNNAGQDLFSNAQPANYGAPVDAYGEDVPMNYSEPVHKRVRKEVKKMKLAVSILLTVVFGLFSFLFGIFSFTGGTVRMGLSSGELSSEAEGLEIGKIIVGDILVQDSMAKVVEANGIVLPERHPERATIADIAASTINASVTSANLSANQINEILKRAHVSDLLSRLIKSYEEYIVTGRTEEFADGICREIKDLVKRSESDVISIAGMKLSDDYEEQLDNALDGEKNSIEGILPAEALDGVSGLIGFALSPVTLIAALVLSAGLIVLAWAITKRVNAALMAGGAAYTLIGIILTAASIILSNLAMISSLDFSVVKRVLSPMLYNTFGMKMLTGGLITLGLGLVLIAVFIIMKVLGKKRAPVQPAEPQE